MRKKGFTMIELLIALFIVVIVFTLVTILYIRGSRIRRTVVAYNEVNEVLTQMINRIIEGSKGILGLKYAKNVNSQENPFHQINSYKIVFSDESWSNTSIYYIAPGGDSDSPSNTGTDTTLWFSSDGTNWQKIDLNNKVLIDSGSSFSYYNSKNLPPDSTLTETTIIKITLLGKSKDPNMKNMQPVRIETFARPRNRLSF